MSGDNQEDMRVVDLINVASGHLAEKGFENPRLEVELLLGHLLGLDRVKLYMEFDRPLSEEERKEFRALYLRRLNREPLQYIIGSTGFREIEVKTDSRALIPRPETELLAEAAISFLLNRPEASFVDLGTGSGVIAASVLYEVPDSRAVAVDISDDALLLAHENARTIGVEDRIAFVQGDMLNALDGRGPFDAILSNPPYVKSADIETLEPEIRDFEPENALDGGGDGLDFLVLIAENAHNYLKPGGLVVLECEGDQADDTAAVFDKTGRYERVEVMRDLADKKRLVKALLK